MPVTVLGIAGSHRRRGNTETLLDWCLDAAREAGAEVTKFRLAELDLHPCRGCLACSKDGVCILKDDMHVLYPHLHEADSLVLAAPIYSMGMPALPKMMIDRCQPFWAWKYVLDRDLLQERRGRGDPPRSGGYLACGGTDYPTTFDGARQVARYLWHVLAVEPAGELLYPRIDEKGEIEDHPSARAEAEDLGRRLAAPRRPLTSTSAQQREAAE